MALQPHPRSPVQQSRARGSPLIPAGHQPLGSDDYPSIEEGRGTPHEPTEGLDPSSYWSDHSNPHDREGETIEGSRTMRNRPYIQCSSAQDKDGASTMIVVRTPNPDGTLGGFGVRGRIRFRWGPWSVVS